MSKNMETSEIAIDVEESGENKESCQVNLLLLENMIVKDYDFGL